jgi:benzoyl-CoA reductase/2-hydroxyglutaryl-CoA dehydratase subunit BcrC/BadD/HgdB
MDHVIGITSTIPVEVIYAAGCRPVDVNNMFITSGDPAALVRQAKMEGFPDTSCSWISGLYSTIMKREIRKVVGVIGGDCAETLALMEVLSLGGVEVIPFAYPHRPDRALLLREIEGFASRLGTTLGEAGRVKSRLDEIRARIHHLDTLLWRDDKAYGREVQLLQLSTSDFEGNPDEFARKVEEKIGEAELRRPIETRLRLAIMGVPPIVRDLYDAVERDGARVVLSEVQRQFSLPSGGDLADSYTSYTYPYGIEVRLEDIGREIERRRVDGVIHYTQAFCFRGIEDIVVRKRLRVPVLTLQGDLPSLVTETMRIRIEAFLDMLSRRKER